MGVAFQKWEINFTLPAPFNWSKQTVGLHEKKATKILGVHRRNLATCGPVVKEQAYLAMSIHCVNMAPLPGLHTHRTISAVP